MAGEILKKRREESGQDLKEIAKILRIRYDYLKAIEDEDFEKLPVEVYAKGYIKEYAKFLKIDPEIIIKTYIQKISPPIIEKPPLVQEIVKEKKTSFKYLLVPVILLAVAGAYFIFSSNSKKTEVSREQTAQPEKYVQPIQKEEGREVQTEKTVKEEARAIEEVQKEKPASKSDGHVLDIIASDTTWVLVNMDSADSKDMLLNYGDSVKLTAKNGFSLKIGNAGGIKLIFDGKDIGKIGEKGQVVNINLPSGKNINPDKNISASTNINSYSPVSQ